MTDTYEVKVRPEKVAEVERIREELDGAAAAVVTEYRGLTVTALAELRTKLNETETSYRVTKNTLTRRAATELGLGDLEEMLVGPVAIAYVKGDIVAAAKAIAAFQKEHPELLVKGGVLDGRVISSDEAKDLATVDPLEVSRAKIAGMLTAPLQRIASLLEAPASRIAFVLQEIGKRAPEPEAAPEAAPQASAEAPEAEAAPEAESAPEAEAPEAEGTSGEQEATTDNEGSSEGGDDDGQG